MASQAKKQKNRNFFAKELWFNPLFKKQVVPNKIKKNNKRKARKKVNVENYE